MGETLPPLPPGADMQVRDVLLRPLPNAVAWAQRGSSPALATRQGGARGRPWGNSVLQFALVAVQLALLPGAVRGALVLAASNTRMLTSSSPMRYAAAGVLPVYHWPPSKITFSRWGGGGEGGARGTGARGSYIKGRPPWWAW